MKGFENGRLQTAARAIGVMQAAYEAAHHYAAERRVFGRPIGDYQLTQVKLGRMATIIQATRQFAYQVARLMANGGGAIQAPMLKAYACQAAEWVTREAMQIHGGMGYAEEFPVSRYFVDARVLSIFEGADEILALKVISRRLIEKAAPHRRPTVCRAIAALPSTAGSPRRPRPSRWKAHPPAPFGAYARGPGIEKMHVTGGHPSVSVQVPATTPWNQRFAPRASVCPGARATLAADETRAHRPPLRARPLSVRSGRTGEPAMRGAAWPDRCQLLAGNDVTVIALWLGHEQLSSTNAYLHADMTQKQEAIDRTTPIAAKPGRYRPPDTLIAFLESL
jgi:Acyl-CoA dehydrogenase, C-terminal domain